MALPLSAAELRPPARVEAGTDFSIASSGSGKADFYLLGPAGVLKQQVDLGGEIAVSGESIENAGLYTALACISGQCAPSRFYVVPAGGIRRLSLIVHPSRVPVSETNAISAVSFVFDKFHNFVLAPQTITFQVTPKEGQPITQDRPTENGIAWIRMTSAKQEGPTKIGATLGQASEVRVVQQVASDACNLRIRANWQNRQLWVETDPVRDCSGNAVPDGTVVSFTKKDAAGTTTVDAPIKRGVAKVQMPVTGAARITVASGVATGNELSVGR